MVRFFRFSLLLSFLLFPCTILQPCGYNPPPFRGYTLIHPDLFATDLSKPFLFTEAYYDFPPYFHFDKEEIQRPSNLEEWQRYFCNIPKLEDIQYLIYEASQKELNQIKKVEKNRQINLPSKLSKNSLAQHLIEYDHEGFLDYLAFAKDCEPLAQSGSLSSHRWRAPKYDQKSALPFIEKGKRAYEKVKDPFLKLRYAFQIVRLEHYYKGCPIEAYSKYAAPLNHVQSIIQDWTLGHKAGALVKSDYFEEKIEGNYLFSKLLTKDNFKNLGYFRSMNIQSNNAWEAVQEYCENDRERATLHYIRALAPNSNGLEEMEAIFELDPSSQHLEILLLRELQKLEAALLKIPYRKKDHWDYRVGNLDEDFAKSKLKALKPFVDKVIKSAHSSRPLLWLSAFGYLEYLDGNLRSAQSTFKKIRKKFNRKTLWDQQIEIFQFVVVLGLMNTIEPWMEEWLGEIVEHNTVFRRHFSESPWTDEEKEYYVYDNYDFIIEKLAYLYYKKGALGKAYLCRYSIYGLKIYPDIRIIKEVLRFLDKEDKNKWEAFLIEKEEIKNREALLDILGTAYLAENRLHQALSIFSQIPFIGDTIKAPFESRHHMHHKISKEPQKYTKLALTKKLIQLELQAKIPGDKGAKAHLLLGNYHFNSSCFGHAWRTKDYFISIRTQQTNPKFKTPLDYDMYSSYYLFGLGARGNYDHRDISQAQYHFKKAESKGSKELAAEACFMLAKCELHTYCESKPFRNRKIDPKQEFLNNYTDNYQRMLEKYSDSEYYKWAIEECSIFENYTIR